MKSNYNYLQKMPFKKNIFILLVLIITLFMLIIAFKKEAYDTFHTYAIFNDNTLEVNIPIENSDAVEESFFKISNQEFSTKVLEIGDFNEVNKINYQTYFLEFINDKYQNKKILEMTFYYNKQRIIKKIMKIIF